MAKKKEPLSVSTVQRNAFYNSMAVADPNKLLVAGSNHTVAGLKIPFALEFLLNCSVLPLGVVLELLGEAGSNKTTFAYEIGRLFYEYSGWSEMFLTEGKISPALVESIMGYTDECLAAGRHPPFMCHGSSHMQEWQQHTVRRVKDNLTLFEKGNASLGMPKGAFAPVQLIVDSIMGQNLEETSNNVSLAGASGRGFAIEAGSLTTYLKTIQDQLTKGPFLLTLINHAKPGTAPNAFTAPPINSPGGKQVRFQSSFRIMLEKIEKSIASEDETTPSLFTKGYSIKMKLLKNSLGEDSSRIIVPYRWRYLPDATGDVRQRGEFLWDAALVGLLIQEVFQQKDLKTETAKKASIAKLDAVVHMRHLGGDKFASKTFGATDAKPLSARQLGKLIQADENIVNGLRNLFGIKRYIAWEKDTDYFKLRNQLTKDMQAMYTAVPAEVVATRG